MVPQITENKVILSNPESENCVIGSALMSMDHFLSEYVLENLLLFRQGVD